MRKAFFIISFLFISSTFAQTEGQETPVEKTNQKAKDQSVKDKLAPVKEPPGFFERTYINANKGAAKGVDFLGEQVDMFLSGDKYISKKKKKNKSTVTLKNAAYVTEGETDNIKYSTQFDARLHLPNLESKWALRFTSYDEDEDERGIERKRPKTAPRRENYGTSIAILQKLGDINVTFRPRLQIKNGLETSHLLKFESTAEVKELIVRPRLELFARADTGTGELLGLELGYEINENLVTMLTNEQEYVDYQNRLSTNHEISLIHSFEEDKTIKYALLYESTNLHEGETVGFHLQEYVFYLSYSHAALKDMLQYNISPRVFFNEDYSFRPRTGLNIGIDLIF